MKHRCGRKPKRDRDSPPAHRQPQGPAANSFEFEFHTCHEEGCGHTECEHRSHDAVEAHQPQHLRANDDPQHDFEDHRRNAKSDRKLGEQRSGDGHQQNQQNRKMSVGKHL